MKTLSEYIKELQELEKEHGDKPVIYAKDDEGNSYQKVNWSGTPCHIYDFEPVDFYQTDFVTTGSDMEEQKLIPNAIIIN